MNMEYNYQYTKKQIKDLSVRRDRPIVITVVLEICVPMIIRVLFEVLLYIADKSTTGYFKTAVYDWFIPITKCCWMLWPIVWLALLVYCCFFTNTSESFRHSDSKQRIKINERQATLSIDTKNGSIEEKFFVKKIRRKKHYLIVYKNLHDFVMIPIEVVNKETVKEVYK